jgi:uracil-DNA glycosylase
MNRNFKESLLEEFSNQLGDWYPKLKNYFESNAFDKVLEALSNDLKSGITVVPQKKDLFKAFELCQWHNVKVVILGQDPYPQIVNKKPVAHGLAFSSNVEQFRPPSLDNIFKEIENSIFDGFDLNMSVRSVNLEDWAKQGVLLLNTSLTTHAGVRGAHLGLWDEFIDEVFKVMNDYHAGIIFCLWGQYAKKYESKINPFNHYILTAGHPSPLSANKGHWFGNNHFITINKILNENNNLVIKFLNDE